MHGTNAITLTLYFIWTSRLIYCHFSSVVKVEAAQNCFFVNVLLNP